MPYTFEDLVARERHRWMRPNAHLFVRPDARGADDCDGALWRERLLHPDHKLWNFHVQTNARRRSPAEQAAKGGQGFVAELARLQARHESLRRAFVELKQQRQRERALERAEAERLKRRYDAAWDKFIAAFHRYWGTCRKAGFDPNRPRVPAGNPDGGQWTSGGGEGGISDPRVLSDATPDDTWIPGARYASNETPRNNVDLEDDEDHDGHTLSKHVGKSDEELKNVLNKNRFVGIIRYEYQEAEGSFSDARTATGLVNRVIARNQNIVEMVASGKIKRAKLQMPFDFVTGKEAFRPSLYDEPVIQETYSVRVVIRRDRQSKRGFRVLTAFPTNPH